MHVLGEPRSAASIRTKALSRYTNALSLTQRPPPPVLRWDGSTNTTSLSSDDALRPSLLSPRTRAIQIVVDDVLLHSGMELTPAYDSLSPTLYHFVAVVLEDCRFEQVALQPVECLGGGVGLVVVFPIWERGRRTIRPLQKQFSERSGCLLGPRFSPHLPFREIRLRFW